MNKLLGTVIAIALGAGTAHAETAQGDTGTVSVGGSVAPICILGQPTPATVDLGVLIATAGTRTGRMAVVGGRQVSLPASFCNFANSAIAVQATALLSSDTSSPQPGFARAVNYTATATGWAPGDASTTTAAQANGSGATSSGTGGTQPLPRISDVTVNLSGFSVPGDGFLTAGNYSGLVVVTLGPVSTSSSTPES